MHMYIDMQAMTHIYTYVYILDMYVFACHYTSTIHSYTSLTSHDVYIWMYMYIYIYVRHCMSTIHFNSYMS